MTNKRMSLNQFNSVMKRCGDTFKVRYVTPTIHPKTKEIVAITIHTDVDSVEFAMTNNPDKDFNMFAEVTRYLDSLT